MYFKHSPVYSIFTYCSFDEKVFTIYGILHVLYRPSSGETRDESRSNYERYRAVILNNFHGVSEHDALAKINVEEMYPEKKKGVGKEKHK